MRREHVDKFRHEVGDWLVLRENFYDIRRWYFTLAWVAASGQGGNRCWIWAHVPVHPINKVTFDFFLWRCVTLYRRGSKSNKLHTYPRCYQGCLCCCRRKSSTPILEQIRLLLISWYHRTNFGCSGYSQNRYFEYAMDMRFIRNIIQNET